MQEDFKRGLYTIIDGPFYHGNDIYVGNYVHIRPDVYIGNRSEIRDFCFIAQGVSVGDNTRIFQYANIGAGTKIGNNCFIGLGVATLNDKHIAWPDKGDWIPNPPIIEDYVRIGARAIIMPGVALRTGSRIGAGAIVTKSTEPGKTYAGTPARLIKLK
jgi:acetyltransferase-like isoleucine patch superfamily enzyme